MDKFCLLVVCLVCVDNGKRLKATLGQYASSHDAKAQKLAEQINTSAGSRSHGEVSRSGNGQSAKSVAYPRTVVPILLTFFGKTQTPVLRNLFGPFAGSHVVMEDQDYVKVLTELAGPTVRAVVSVDWEGWHLRKENLRALEDFRAAYPEVPLTHFLNATYFTRSEAHSTGDEWSPLQAMSPIDEHGLHLHGWKSLVESSGVQYRLEPNTLQTPEELDKSLEIERRVRKRLEEESDQDTSWKKRIVFPKTAAWKRNKERTARDRKTEAWKSPFAVHLEKYLSRDVGQDVDITAYTVDELRSIISNAKAILEKQGFTVGESFRAGAWLAGPNVLEAIKREGFLVNSSAVNFDKLIRQWPLNKTSWRDRPLSEMLRDLWPDITDETQPFVFQTPAGWILEMPDTGGMADFTTVEDMVHHIDNAVQKLDSEDRFVHIGFRQETAATHAPRVIAAIREIKRKHGHRVVFETLQASAQHAIFDAAMEATKSEPHVVSQSAF